MEVGSLLNDMRADRLLCRFLSSDSLPLLFSDGCDVLRVERRTDPSDRVNNLCIAGLCLQWSPDLVGVDALWNDRNRPCDGCSEVRLGFQLDLQLLSNPPIFFEVVCLVDSRCQRVRFQLTTACCQLSAKRAGFVVFSVYPRPGWLSLRYLQYELFIFELDLAAEWPSRCHILFRSEVKNKHEFLHTLVLFYFKLFYLRDINHEESLLTSPFVLAHCLTNTSNLQEHDGGSF